MHAILKPALESVRRCVGDDGGGKLNIQLTNRSGALEVVVEPGQSLDPTARACVLEALTSVYLEQTGSNAGGPAVPPSGFTSMVTVSW
jgi:hypothetical protein